MTMVLGIVTHYDVAKLVDIASPAYSGSGLVFFILNKVLSTLKMSYIMTVAKNIMFKCVLQMIPLTRSCKDLRQNMPDGSIVCVYI